MEKFGFIYIWFDRKHKRYYVGSHWGLPDDGYICSSRWMRKSHKRRSEDFKRRIISKIYTNRKDLLIEEERWLKMMKPEEMTSGNTTDEERVNVRYYNLRRDTWEYWHTHPEGRQTVGEKISRAKAGKKSGPFSEERKLAISEGKRKAFEKRREETGSNYAPEIQGAWQNNGGYEACVTPEANVKRSESLKKAWAKRSR